MNAQKEYHARLDLVIEWLFPPCGHSRSVRSFGFSIATLNGFARNLIENCPKKIRKLGGVIT
jgi:hypothetical protein